MNLPEFLSPPPEKEALLLGLEHVIFDPVDEDEPAEDEGPLRAFLLLDASQSPDITICLEGFNAKARCLFDGQAQEDLADVAPWLVELERYSDTWDWFCQDGWANNWGVLIHSRLTMPKLKVQMKKFIKIEDEDGELYFFKYYRPEHLNTYLPVFEEKQLESFMRGITAIYGEDREDPTRVIRHSRTARGRYNDDAINLIERGKPFMIQPPTEADVAAILASVEEGA
ncbi:DUF4123 domain-containing protein [Alphaproteobacteria bacterium KMM 3653]|uniref:DUF4123 domain-containing protein n=1 Tax=Harenicola maris TaxID=2841044 RepID=A0AAP2G805_9RHOB|nr:DUF4123 domain-containing protein [Harenicola maris]